MPIYEYVCSCCSVRFDRLQTMGSHYAECPICNLPGNKALSTFATPNSGFDYGASNNPGTGGCGGCAGGGCACSGGT